MLHRTTHGGGSHIYQTTADATEPNKYPSEYAYNSGSTDANGMLHITTHTGKGSFLGRFDIKSDVGFELTGSAGLMAYNDAGLTGLDWDFGTVELFNVKVSNNAGLETRYLGENGDIRFKFGIKQENLFGDLSIGTVNSYNIRTHRFKNISNEVKVGRPFLEVRSVNKGFGSEGRHLVIGFQEDASKSKGPFGIKFNLFARYKIYY
jgi:hypothetical protein